MAGLLLAVPELVALDLPGLVAAAGYPGTSAIPATSYLLSLLALKLVGVRRVSHVDDLAADLGAGLFAGLVALPKATALTTYSYRLDHTRQTAPARRARQGDARRRPHHRRRRGPRLGLPRHHALGRGRRPGEALRATPFPAHPLSADASSPKTAPAKPSSTPTPT